MTLSKNDIHHYDTQHYDIQYYDTQQKGLICETQHKRHSAKMTLSILCIECHYAECHNLFNVTLSVIVLIVIMLNVVLLSVMAPLVTHAPCFHRKQ
jgi:hypothetical protein